MKGLDVRKDFPILKIKVHGKPLIYLDNAATSQKPKTVIDAISTYYKENNSNVHRGLHTLSEVATQQYEESRSIVAKFIHAQPEEIVFTHNTTESLNLVARGFLSSYVPGSEMVLTPMEHHSNLVPWITLAKKHHLVVRYVPMHPDGTLDLKTFQHMLSSKTKLVAVTHVSNVLGTINPVEEIARLAHRHDTLVVVDGAQSVPHLPVDVQKMGCDFLAFSSHKMLGPTGVGVLYGRKALLEKMEPFLYGGGMINEVTYENATWAELPNKFEAGTPNIADVIAFGTAVKYLQKIGMGRIQKHEQLLTQYVMQKLGQMEGVTIYGPSAEKRIGVVSFNLTGVHPHDVATLLDKQGIAIRAGHHCTMPLHKNYGMQSSCRVSFYLYNTMKEIDALCEALEKVKKVFEKKATIKNEGGQDLKG
ncbi:MAG TPA: cysteine desulfurase [Candidatus Nanoarchaeia archaeon]|nr:cysteine desulfurase [Candidatus Nanoarchaeia archaeon]